MINRRPGSEQRICMRFNKVFPVLVGSEIYGDSSGVARNISTGGMLVEMMEPLPLGSFVTVHFRMPDSQADLTVRAEVKHHYCFNYAAEGQPCSARGIGLRFVELVEDAAAELRSSFSRARVLH
jgi:PilZ domain